MKLTQNFVIAMAIALALALLCGSCRKPLERNAIPKLEIITLTLDGKSEKFDALCENIEIKGDQLLFIIHNDSVAAFYNFTKVNLGNSFDVKADGVLIFEDVTISVPISNGIFPISLRDGRSKEEGEAIVDLLNRIMPSKK